VKLMLGELQPTEGVVAREQGSRVALLNQHHADQLNLDESPLGTRKRILKRLLGDAISSSKHRNRSTKTGLGRET